MWLAAALVVLLPLFFLVLKKTLSGSGNLPPGPGTWQILQISSEFKAKPHVVFRSLAKIYGPLMSLQIGSRVVIVASSPETAREILHTQDKKFSGRFLPWVHYKVPAGEEASITTSKECNDSWKFLRGLSQSFLFSSKSIESKADMRKAKVVEMVKYLQSKQGIAVRLDDLIESTIVNIVTDILVSRKIFDLRREDENDEKIREAVHQVIEMASSALGLSDLFPFLSRVDFRGREKAAEIYRRVKLIWGDKVEERRLIRSRGGDVKADSESDGDFLNILLDNGFRDDQIYIILMELLLGGTHSSGIVAVWMMAELIKNPDIMRRVRDEVAKAFQGDDMTINESILTDSPYLQACLKETLRFHNPGPFLMPHRAMETCKIDNYTIPKDSIVLVNAGTLSMEPESWKDADVFDPDRFLEEKIDYRGSHFEFIPFSAGRRMCPGSNVAFKNIQIVVASLVHYFDWSLPNGAELATIDMAEKFAGLVKKEKPLHLIPKSVSI